MARYTGAVCRLCRREGTKLFLKGDRCFTEKCGVERRAYPPGQHGQGRGRTSDYGLQLREKQKVKRMYGVAESQFRGTMDAASHMRGRAGENRWLERVNELLEFRMQEILMLLKEQSPSIEECADILDLSPAEVTKHLQTAAKRRLTVFDEEKKRFAVVG